MNKASVAVLILATCQMPVLANERDESRDGGAGDTTALEFTNVARTVLKHVRTRPDLFPEVDPDNFEQALKDTQVKGQPYVEEGGREVDARNNGKDMIEVSAPRWEKLAPRKRMVLAFHEFLGILGLEKDTFPISSRLALPLDSLKTGDIYLRYDQEFDEKDPRLFCIYEISVDLIAQSVTLNAVPPKNWKRSSCSYGSALYVSSDDQPDLLLKAGCPEQKYCNSLNILNNGETLVLVDPWAGIHSALYRKKK